jgi:hypothetical protein
VAFEGNDQLFYETSDRCHDLVGERSAVAAIVESELKLMIDVTANRIRELEDDAS